MKRLWLGAAVLLLLALGATVTLRMTRIHLSLGQELAAAAGYADRGQWDEADESLRRALSGWQRQYRLTAAITDHGPMEQIDARFATLRVYGRLRDREAFCACCAGLEAMVTAMGEAHCLSWWNLL